MKNKIIVGVDESGRGPVIGNLVMAALAFKEEDIKKLEWLGVKDSKLLTAVSREELFERIREIVHDFRIEVIEPDAIDLSLDESNLNWLEADTSARMVSELKPTRCIVDCPSVNIPAYKEYFRKKVNNDAIEIIMEHKADMNHIVVAAASVVAKVIRDRSIDHLKNDIGKDFGSGYMSDPKTKDFLEKYYDKYPVIFRKRWKSYKKMEMRKSQKSLGEY